MKIYRKSKIRNSVFEALRYNHKHPTAESLHKKLKKTIPNISLATVYRNLNRLAETNYISKMDGPDGLTHYDCNVMNHYHFVCDRCHRIYDVNFGIAPFLEIKASQETGHTMTSCAIVFGGICRTCMKKENNN